jgi:AcrR family transcriptional regulator
VALELFLARGFEAVTVADVARAADVSTNTVFNYFGSKEDLFFDRQAEVEEAWSRIVRARAPGESAVRALRRDYLEALARRDPRSGLSDELVPFARLIQGSPVLQAREREIGERSAATLARTLATETAAEPGDLTPRVVAHLVAAVYRTLHAESRRRLLAAEAADTIYPWLVDAARRAFTLLEAGVGDYATHRA